MDASANHFDLIVVGAGAAGLFAAANAAEAGVRTLLIEKMRKPGIKILASGGTKCNVTSTLPIKELGLWFGQRAERFLRHGLHTLSPKDLRELLSAEGVGTEESAFEKVFPQSGRASDVLRAFLQRLERSGADLRLGLACQNLTRGEDDGSSGYGWRLATPDGELCARRVIVTSGGLSFPKTGCTGDGYGWLQKLGHTVARPRPALVPLRAAEPWVKALTGISVPEAEVFVRDQKGKVIFRRRRPLLFTHRGLSGPGPMDASGYLNVEVGPHRPLYVDFLPEHRREDLEQMIKSDHGGGLLAQCLADIFPRRLARGIIQGARIPNDRRAAELRKDERLRLLDFLKGGAIQISGDEGFDKAEVTAGGVKLDEVNPKTMESRIVPGLYIAGEILDLVGPIGGFNFQAAFSTGTLAGRAAATQVQL
ncbi:MAG: aminoacetone oxidase family FAD-binding enzyme [Planctomycetota bacterium]